MRARNIALLLLLGAIWGSSFLFVNLSLRGFTPVTLAALRCVLGALFLLAVTAAMGLRLPRAPRVWAIFAALGLFSSALPFLLINAGQTRIPASVAAILISAVPLFVLLLAHVFTDDRIRPYKAAGVAIGFGGIVLLVGPAALEGLTRGLVGQLFVLAATFCFAMTTVGARRFVTGVSPVVSSFCSLAMASAFTVPLALIFDEAGAQQPGWDSLIGLAGLGFLSTGVAYIVYYRLTATAGPNFVAMNNYIAPSIGVAWGMLLLGERPGWHAFAALAVILVGVAIATWKGGNGRPKEAPRP
jgi:drug/metabolite transporter (DMT)-like permease